MMRKTVLIGLIACVLSGGALLFGQAGINPGFSLVTAIDMTFQWKVVGENLECILSAPTSGWIAVGFDPSRRMRDANMIIGRVENNNVEVFDHYGASTISHIDDTDRGGSFDVTEISGSEMYGMTELRFTIPLDSGDKRDRPLTQGKEYDIILAYGRSDNLRAQHVARTTVKVTL